MIIFFLHWGKSSKDSSYPPFYGKDGAVCDFYWLKIPRSRLGFSNGEHWDLLNFWFEVATLAVERAGPRATAAPRRAADTWRKHWPLLALYTYRFALTCRKSLPTAPKSLPRLILYHTSRCMLFRYKLSSQRRLLCPTFFHELPCVKR